MTGEMLTYQSGSQIQFKPVATDSCYILGLT